VKPGDVVGLHPTEIERIVLGSLLLSSGRYLDEVGDVLREYHFYSSQHKEIYKWIYTQYSNNEPADCAILVNSFGSDGHNKYGDIAYISRLGDNAVDKYSLSSYVDKLVNSYKLRTLQDTIKNIGSKLTKLEDTPSEILKLAESSILDITSSDGSTSTIISLADACKERKTRWGKILAGEDTEYVPTGFGSIDRHYHGWPRGYMTVIGGRPEVGKTMFLVSGVLRAAETSIPQGILSIEMPRSRLVDRMATIKAGMSVNQLHGGDEESMDVLSEATDSLSSLPIYIDDSSVDALAVESSIRRMVRQHGCKVVWVDYLQLIKAPKKHRGGNRTWEVDDISEMLRMVAKKENIAVISLIQLNRSVEDSVVNRRSGVPMQHHFRGSDKPLHDAALAFGLYRPFMYKAPKKPTSKKKYTNEELSDMHQPFELVSLKSRDHSKKDVVFWSRLKVQRIHDDHDEGFSPPDWGFNDPRHDGTMSKSSSDNGVQEAYNL